MHRAPVHYHMRTLLNEERRRTISATTDWQNGVFDADSGDNSIREAVESTGLSNEVLEMRHLLQILQCRKSSGWRVLQDFLP